MAKLNTAIRGAQIAVAVAADGLTWVTDDTLQVDFGTDKGLKFASNKLEVELKAAASGLEISSGLGIADDGVSNTMLANMTQGTIKVGGAADAPTDLDAKTDGQILIGDGTDINSVAVTGDVTITNAGVTAIGATKVLDSMINDDVATGLAGVGLSASSGAMAIDLNELPIEATFDPNADYIAIEDVTDAGSDKTLWSVIATAIAGTGLTATNGVLAADAVSDNIIETDIKLENESSNCTGAQTTFTLDNTPVVNSVQVFLNGLLQEEGSGKDYTLSGTTVEFATAPASGDILLIHYILND